MGITVEGQKCPICGGYVFDNDDLVFCPVCGAPHHRDCYEAVGHCALAADHGTERQYQRPTQTADATSADSNTNQSAQANGEEGPTVKKQCRGCGSFYGIDERFCPKCGVPSAPVYTPFGSPLNYFDPMGGVGDDEKIEDIEAKKVKDYIAVNTPRYLPKFKKLSRKNKLSWNWAAFLFPHAWFFYRKMYLKGILFIILTVTAGLLSSSLNFLVQDFPDEVLKSYPLMFSYMYENIGSLNPYPLYTAIAGGALSILISVFAGITGDWFYRSSVLSSIRKITEECDAVDIAPALRTKGGVNIFLGMLALFATDWIVAIIYTFI